MDPEITEIITMLRIVILGMLVKRCQNGMHRLFIDARELPENVGEVVFLNVVVRFFFCCYRVKQYIYLLIIITFYANNNCYRNAVFIFAERVRIREEYGDEEYDVPSRYNALRTHYNVRRMVRE